MKSNTFQLIGLIRSVWSACASVHCTLPWKIENNPFASAILRTAQACSLAILMPRFIDAFPQSKDAALTGTVDLWFIVHDGGILLLTAYLLLRNRVWCKCRLRVFVVTGEPDTNGELKKVMTRFVYDLRISAEVEIVEMVSL